MKQKPTCRNFIKSSTISWVKIKKKTHVTQGNCRTPQPGFNQKGPIIFSKTRKPMKTVLAKKHTADNRELDYKTNQFNSIKNIYNIKINLNNIVMLIINNMYLIWRSSFIDEISAVRSIRSRCFNRESVFQITNLFHLLAISLVQFVNVPQLVSTLLMESRSSNLKANTC